MHRLSLLRTKYVLCYIVAGMGGMISAVPQLNQLFTNVQKSTAALRVVGVHTKFGVPQFLCRLCAARVRLYFLERGSQAHER